MEWMLQVVDEIDDAVGAMRHGCVGFTATLGGLMMTVGSMLKMRTSRLRAHP